jgi:hypothetical protein
MSGIPDASLVRKTDIGAGFPPADHETSDLHPYLHTVTSVPAALVGTAARAIRADRPWRSPYPFQEQFVQQELSRRAIGAAVGERPSPQGWRLQHRRRAGTLGRGSARCGSSAFTAAAKPTVWLAWRLRAVQELARATFKERRLPDGKLVPARLIALACHLEDAGCTDAELLGQLRGPAPHARGSRSLELIVSRE